MRPEGYLKVCHREFQYFHDCVIALYAHVRGFAHLRNRDVNRFPGDHVPGRENFVDLGELISAWLLAAGDRLHGHYEFIFLTLRFEAQEQRVVLNNQNHEATSLNLP